MDNKKTTLYQDFLLLISILPTQYIMFGTIFDNKKTRLNPDTYEKKLYQTTS